MLAWINFQAKISSHPGVYVWVQGEWQKYDPSFPPLSKDEGLTNIGHSMSTGNLIWGVNGVTVSCLIHYDRLLQNATDVITKCDSYFIPKCYRSLLQIASGFFIQNATVLLQNLTIITNCDDFITKYDSYHKMLPLLQIATVQAYIKSTVLRN